jgi:hypothetical protein
MSLAPRLLYPDDHADDLVIFLTPSAVDFTCIRQILSLFAGASGLASNLDKCAISPFDAPRKMSPLCCRSSRAAYKASPPDI